MLTRSVVAFVSAFAVWACCTKPSETGVTVTQIPNEGWVHVPEGTTITYNHNPPASGTHYPVWLRYEIFSTPLARGYWVHNLEHGAIVMLYRTGVSNAVVTALIDAYNALPKDPKCTDARAVLLPDPAIPRSIAVLAADWILQADTVDAQAIQDFTLAHRDKAPESICGLGTRP